MQQPPVHCRSKHRQPQDRYNKRFSLQKRTILSSILATAKPINGLGFFVIDKPMVTSFVGVATTYIVVLVQFNLSENPVMTTPPNVSSQSMFNISSVLQQNDFRSKNCNLTALNYSCISFHKKYIPNSTYYFIRSLCFMYNRSSLWGSGCGSVGRAVASETRGPQIVSSHRQILYKLSVCCIETIKINQRGWEQPSFFKKTLFLV